MSPCSHPRTSVVIPARNAGKTRLAQGQPSCEPTVETLPITAEIEIEVARHIVWGGAIARRAELAGTERHRQVPVLMYHRIADAGPVALAPYRVSPEIRGDWALEDFITKLEACR